MYICMTVVFSCNAGFMQLDLLRKRAEKISGGNYVSTNRLDNELRLMPGLNFTCSGNITAFLLSGIVKRFILGSRDQYPAVQLWRPGFISPHQIASQEIKLAEGNFKSSPNGVLQYNLTTPIQFQSRDWLAVNHPRSNSSVVQLFYANLSTSLTYIIAQNFTITTTDQSILLLPIIGELKLIVIKSQ